MSVLAFESPTVIQSSEWKKSVVQEAQAAAEKRAALDRQIRAWLHAKHNLSPDQVVVDLNVHSSGDPNQVGKFLMHYTIAGKDMAGVDYRELRMSGGDCAGPGPDTDTLSALREYAHEEPAMDFIPQPQAAEIQ